MLERRYCYYHYCVLWQSRLIELVFLSIAKSIWKKRREETFFLLCSWNLHDNVIEMEGIYKTMNGFSPRRNWGSSKENIIGHLTVTWSALNFFFKCSRNILAILGRELVPDFGNMPESFGALANMYVFIFAVLGILPFPGKRIEFFWSRILGFYTRVANLLLVAMCLTTAYVTFNVRVSWIIRKRFLKFLNSWKFFKQHINDSQVIIESTQASAIVLRYFILYSKRKELQNALEICGQFQRRKRRKMSDFLSPNYVSFSSSWWSTLDYATCWFTAMRSLTRPGKEVPERNSCQLGK